jgi:hypothetical protein
MARYGLRDDLEPGCGRKTFAFDWPAVLVVATTWFAIGIAIGIAL